MGEFYGYCMAHYGPPTICRCEKCRLKAASDRIAELKADRKAHAENEMRLMAENAKLKAKLERLEKAAREVAEDGTNYDDRFIAVDSYVFSQLAAALEEQDNE